MSITNGIHHLGLSVSKLEAAIEFFTEALEFNLVGRDEGYPAAFLKDDSVVITLWATEGNPAPFDRKKNEGLHHVAFNVKSSDALESLYHRLIERTDITVEKEITAMSPGSTTRHFFIRIPGGPRVEFIASK